MRMVYQNLHIDKKFFKGDFMDIRQLSTESRNSKSMQLDEMSSLEIARLMNEEDKKIPDAIEKELDKIAKVIDWVSDAFKNGNRLFYMGAGTSGRLGVLDASECPPTFGVPNTMVVGLIAGGDIALRNAVEKAEDSKDLGEKDLAEHNLCCGDIVVGIAASGRTPYVIGGLEYANKIGCKTAAIACTKDSLIGQTADLAIEPTPGPEVLTGSTRLKAGTTQKLICNMITTGAMVRSGKCYQNLMVDVVQSNEKLQVRAENIVIDATGAKRDEARRLIDEANGKVKVAIVMKILECDVQEALNRLEEANGHVKKAIR